MGWDTVIIFLHDRHLSRQLSGVRGCTLGDGLTRAALGASGACHPLSSAEVLLGGKGMSSRVALNITAKVLFRTVLYTGCSTWGVRVIRVIVRSICGWEGSAIGTRVPTIAQEDPGMLGTIA